MPTAAKLVASIFFALLAYFVSDLMKPLLPEGTPTGMLSPINALVGIVFGWRIVGNRVGDGLRGAIGNGLTAAAAIYVTCLLIWGGYEMLRRAVRPAYGDPTEAITDMIRIMGEYAVDVSTPQTIGALAVGAMLGGWLAEGASRRWA